VLAVISTTRAPSLLIVAAKFLSDVIAAGESTNELNAKYTTSRARAAGLATGLLIGFESGIHTAVKISATFPAW
jgi:hypothetical protein